MKEIHYQYITPEIAKEFYISCVVAHKMCVTFLDGDMSNFYRSVASRTKKLIETFDMGKEFDDDLFVLELQAQMNEASQKDEVVQIVGKSPFKDGWYIALIDIFKQAVDEIS